MERPVARRLRGLRTVEAGGIFVPVASNRLSRLLGLALLARGSAGTGLLIPRCRSVHTFGMRFDLDLIFIGEDGAVVRTELRVPPGKMLFERSADRVLELPSAGGSWMPGGGSGGESGAFGP